MVFGNVFRYASCQSSAEVSEGLLRSPEATLLTDPGGRLAVASLSSARGAGDKPPRYESPSLATVLGPYYDQACFHPSQRPGTATGSYDIHGRLTFHTVWRFYHQDGLVSLYRCKPSLITIATWPRLSRSWR